MAGLTINGVSKSFGQTEVVRDFSLAAEVGEFVVLVGPSGCGKSTLLRMIAGLEDLSKGQILIDDEDVTNRPASQRGVAMVFQSYALYPHMTVEANLSFGLEMARVKKRERQEIIASVSRILRIDHLLHRRPRELSGGQRQRVAIGRALVREPKLFLFDEPLSNLDTELRVRMRSELVRLHQRLGTTMVYVTHDQTEAMTLADRVVVMRDGVIEQAGTPMALYEDPDNMFVAGFLGTPRMNFLDAQVIGMGAGKMLLDVPRLGLANFAVEPRRMPGKPPGKVIMGVRPDSFLDHSPTMVRLKADFIENLGNASFLHNVGDDGESLAGDPLICELPRRYRKTKENFFELGLSGRSCLLFEPTGLRL